MNIDLEIYRPFMKAVRSNDVSLLETLVANHPDLNDESILNQALDAACESGSEAAVQFLIQRGANINHRDEFGDLPICKAAAEGHLGIVQFLLELGAEIDISGPVGNPYYDAIYENQLEVVKFLLQAGIDPHAVFRRESGPLRNCLSYALDLGHTEIAELLGSAGCHLPVEGVDHVVNDLPPGTVLNPAHAAISTAVSARFGPVDALALQEIVPICRDLHIAVHVIRPTAEHPYYTLFTTGMSDRAQRVPAGQEAFRYTEMLLHLPDDWPVHAMTEASSWPLQWLRQLAYFPHLQGTWLGGPHTIVASDDPPVPLGPNTQQSCWLLMADFGNWSPVPLEDGRLVRMVTLIPLYTQERDFELLQGIRSLLERFERAGMTPVIDIDRASVVS